MCDAVVRRGKSRVLPGLALQSSTWTAHNKRTCGAYVLCVLLLMLRAGGRFRRHQLTVALLVVHVLRVTSCGRFLFFVRSAPICGATLVYVCDESDSFICGRQRFWYLEKHAEWFIFDESVWLASINLSQPIGNARFPVVSVIGQRPPPPQNVLHLGASRFENTKKKTTSRRSFLFRVVKIDPRPKISYHKST